MHWLKTRSAACNLHATTRSELRIEYSNRGRDSYACVIPAGVDHDLKPRMNVQGCDFREAWKREVSTSFALCKGVDAVSDCANEYGDDNERDDGSSLALPSDFLKHPLLASLGQALPASL